jgi:hypothetical protein
MSFSKATAGTSVAKTSRPRTGGAAVATVATVDTVEFDLNDFGSPSPSPTKGQQQQQHRVIEIASDDEEDGYEEEPVRQWPPPRATQAERRAKVAAAAAGTKTDDRDPAILVFEELKALRHQVGGAIVVVSLFAITDGCLQLATDHDCKEEAIIGGLSIRFFGPSSPAESYYPCLLKDTALREVALCLRRIAFLAWCHYYSLINLLSATTLTEFARIEGIDEDNFLEFVGWFK